MRRFFLDILKFSVTVGLVAAAFLYLVLSELPRETLDLFLKADAVVASAVEKEQIQAQADVDADENEAGDEAESAAFEKVTDSKSLDDEVVELRQEQENLQEGAAVKPFSAYLVQWIFDAPRITAGEDHEGEGAAVPRRSAGETGAGS